MKLDDNLDFYANKILNHYFKILFEATGKNWDSDSDTEIRQIFEQIQNFVEYEVERKIKEAIK